MSHLDGIEGDDSGFKLQKKLLEGKKGKGMDIDFFRFNNQTQQWNIIEFCKCRATPAKSHPQYFWKDNKGKWQILWKMATALNATLEVVMYDDLNEEFLIIPILDVTENGIKSPRTNPLNLREMMDWWQAFNGY